MRVFNNPVELYWINGNGVVQNIFTDSDLKVACENSVVTLSLTKFIELYVRNYDFSPDFRRCSQIGGAVNPLMALHH